MSYGNHLIRPANWLLFALVAGFLGAAEPQKKAEPPSFDSLPALQARLTEQVAQPRLATAAFGIKIVSLDTGKTLFEHEANRLLKPASNNKLYTGALALDRLGPDRRIRTSVYAAAGPDAVGTISGDLIIYGRGDPGFAARFNNGDYQKALQPLVEAIVKAGVKTIQGDLVGDESYFHGPPLGDSWTWDDLQNYYGAEASSLTIQDNVVDLVFKPGSRPGEPVVIVTKPPTDYLKFVNRSATVTNGGPRGIDMYRPIGENTVYVWGKLPLNDPGLPDSMAVHDPARWCVVLLKDALAAKGITVSGGIRTVNWLERETSSLDYPKLAEVAFVESRPIGEIVRQMMKPSQNLYAQLLLLQVGASAEAAKPAKEGSRKTTEDFGIAEMNAFLTEIGIKRGEVHIQEGSGLSRTAILTPNASVTLLTRMAKHRHADVFRDALPIAGVDGSLKSRLKGTLAENNARAKTGSLGFVNTLSGYMTTAARERLAFSLMLNNYENSDAKHSGRAQLDAIVEMLAGLTVKTE